ncbi:uncharacterized protein METZ01_LOCUS148779 [marine metagenome]|uniref:Uncharacterized protein n=1 Tax=marine metagenome TaxID=408172 RepID=A0A382A300_9ZZZZ
MVVPELHASIIHPSTFESIEFFIIILFSDSVSSTPKFLHAFIVAMVSLDFKIFLIILLPSESDAMNTALCV